MNPFDPIPCLDKGAVQLIDTMPRWTHGLSNTLDRAVADAARVTGSWVLDWVKLGVLPPEYATKHQKHDITHEGVRRIIRFLMEHGHTSPFEQVSLKFAIRCPVFVARQYDRHRMRSKNEESRRYHDGTELPIECCSKIRDYDFTASNQQALDHASTGWEYDTPHEVLRAALPQSMYTLWVERWDLHNLFHFLRLRTSPHAQPEIRVYAEAIASIVQQIAPLSYEAWEDFQKNAVRLSGPAAERLGAYIRWLENQVGQSPGVEMHPTEHPRMTKGEAARSLEQFREMVSRSPIVQ